MEKLSKLENQIRNMIQWISVHYVGQQYKLDKCADQHGIGSQEFERELHKYFESVNKHKIEMDTLKWVLGEIENVEKEK